jgi:trimethylamine--corrinoid protein Co-methyltransferase
LLAGLVFSQLVKEGSEVILGSLPAAFNMHTMGSYYTPASYLLNLGCAEMMDHYEIPHCGTSGSSNGRGADLLSSGHLWLNHLSSCMGKVGCAPFVGGNFDSLVFSPATAVLSDQIIGEAREFVRGFPLDDEAVNLEEIKAVGQGGDYFTSEQTLAFLQELSSNETLWSPMSLHTWKSRGMPSPDQELIEHTRALFSRAKKASVESLDLVKKGEEYIEKTLTV